MESRELKSAKPVPARKVPKTSHPLLAHRHEVDTQAVSFTYTALAALAPAVLLGLIMVIASSVAFNV